MVCEVNVVSLAQKARGKQAQVSAPSLPPPSRDFFCTPACLPSSHSRAGCLCLSFLTTPAVLCCAVLWCAVLQRINRKAMSSLLQSTLEAVIDVDKFPKASVDVNVLVLQVGVCVWGQGRNQVRQPNRLARFQSPPVAVDTVGWGHVCPPVRLV